MAADRNNDDIAAALHGLNGDGADAHPEQPTDASAPRPAPPARSPAAAPSPRAAARPAFPGAPTPPARPPSASPAENVGSSAREATRPVAARPPAPRVRPASPVRSAAPPTNFETTTESDFADLSSAGSTGGYSAAPTRSRARKASNLRQTLIPILLTSGVMTLTTGAMRWVVDEAAPLARIPAWTALAAIAMGVVLIGLAAVNMLQVRAATETPRA